MRHLPFLKALAKVSDIDDPVWRDAAAGYLVLRFFDQWIEEGPARMAKDTGLPALKARIRAMPDVEPKVQQFLLTAIQAMVDASKADPALVAGPLLAYGKYLESAGRLELAAHVCRTVVDVLDPAMGGRDPETAATVFMQYAKIMRLLGDFDAARGAYERAATLAQKVASTRIGLLAQVGMANNLRARGNLGDAEVLLDRLLPQAVEAGMTGVEAVALHSRAGIRQLRGAHDAAVIDYFRAYGLTEDAVDREMILGDLAACAAEVGYRKMARDAHRLLAYTTKLPIVRSAALINLLELAVLDGEVKEFNRIRAYLDTYTEQHAVPVEHRIHAALYTAAGIERFGTREAAVNAYQIVVEDARRAGMHQIAFKAEACLEAFMKNVEPASHAPAVAEPPPILQHVVDTIAELSSLAGAAS